MPHAFTEAKITMALFQKWQEIHSTNGDLVKLPRKISCITKTLIIQQKDHVVKKEEEEQGDADFVEVTGNELNEIIK